MQALRERCVHLGRRTAKDNRVATGALLLGDEKVPEGKLVRGPG